MTVAEAVTLIAAVGAFIVSTGAAFVSVWNAVHLGRVHSIVNSQATKFEALSRELGHAEGKAEVTAAPKASRPKT